MNTETPETETEREAFHTPSGCEVVSVNFAYKLGRERNEARKLAEEIRLLAEDYSVIPIVTTPFPWGGSEIKNAQRQKTMKPESETSVDPEDNSSTSPCSPFVVGDIVSIRKWLCSGVNRQGVSVAGRVTRVWRGNCKSGIMVRVRTGLFRWVDLDSEWATLL